MKQLELFPYLLDQKVIDYYGIVLSQLKLLTKAKLGRIELLSQLEQMRLQAIIDRKKYFIPELKYRRFLKNIETTLDDIHQDKDLKNIDNDIEKWTTRRKILEFKINNSSRF